MKIIKFSINRPITVLMFYLLIIITGVISFLRLPIDFLPEVGYPQLTVITIYENSSPREVETLISQPIEEVVSTLKGVRKVTSVSRNDVSIVTIKFNWGTTISYASLSLREKLDNISYSLPKRSDVTLTVFDIRGQEVTTLHDATKPPGNYEVQWNGRDQSGNPVSTGVYFCRFQADNFWQTIKMVYLK